MHRRILTAVLLGVVACCKASDDVATVPDFQSDIRGGTEVETAIPWYVVFDDPFICGGVLIHEDIVLTTASCVESQSSREKTTPSQVRIGSLNRYDGGTVVGVSRVRIHPDWTGDVVQGNDIAVLKLTNTVDNQVAVLNSVKTLPQMGSNLFVMGFGLVNDDTLPENLQGVFYEFLQLCQNRFDLYDADVHLCADATPQRGTCGGDTGSPAVLSDTRTVVGLSSFSDNFCESQTFDAYTRVSTYYNWVQQQICSLAAHEPGHCTVPSTGSGNAPCAIFSWSGIQQVQRFFGV